MRKEKIADNAESGQRSHVLAPRIVIVAAVCLLPLYFLGMYWLKAIDPIVVSPAIDGEIIRLYPPFVAHGRGVIAADYWLASIADSDTNNCRSPVMIYENDQPLGPLHSSSSVVAGFGMGRAAHRRSTDDPLRYDGLSVFLFSSTDNSNPSTNGRAYWAVKPKLDAITCPDIEPQRIPEPQPVPDTAAAAEPKKAPKRPIDLVLEITSPKLVIELPNFEVSRGSRLVIAGGIEQLEEFADAPEGDRSPVLLYEDDHLLGPPHSLHRDIAELGSGRYSHWKGHGMVFSTSDNSDPQTNGRKYFIVVP